MTIEPTRGLSAYREEQGEAWRIRRLTRLLVTLSRRNVARFVVRMHDHKGLLSVILTGEGMGDRVIMGAIRDAWAEQGESTYAVSFACGDIENENH